MKQVVIGILVVVCILVVIWLLLFGDLSRVFASQEKSPLISPEVFDNPTITHAVCNGYIVVQWDDPQTTPSINVGATLYLMREGSGYTTFKDAPLIDTTDNKWVWAVYIGDLDKTMNWRIEAGFITVEQGGFVGIVNTPHPVECHHLYFPSLLQQN